MIKPKLAWLTDIHLNFLDSDARKQFYQSITQTNCDATLITGDIAEAPSICKILQEFSAHTNQTIYFVLGNHDYYSGSVVEVREKMVTLCEQNKQLIWLGNAEIIPLTKHTVLLGQDGWADARYGDFNHSPVRLNDSRLIAELFQAALLNQSELKKSMQQLADSDAKKLEKTLNQSSSPTTKNLIIATHV